MKMNVPFMSSIELISFLITLTGLSYFKTHLKIKKTESKMDYMKP